MKTLKDIINQARNALGFPLVNSNNPHFNNLENNEVIEVDGKQYVKVKLRFVDSMDSNSTQLVLQLEEEIESLQENLEKISNINLKLEKKLQDLQTLNINLMRENKIEALSHEKKIQSIQENLVKAQEIMDAEILKRKEKNIEIQNLYIEFKQKGQEKYLQIQKLQNELQTMEKDRKIQKQNHQEKLNRLEKEIYSLKKIVNEHKDQANKTEGSRTGLLKKIAESKKEMESKNNLILEKDALIKTLTNLFFEKEKKIAELEEYIELVEAEQYNQV